jgi:hypothetical protein
MKEEEMAAAAAAAAAAEAAALGWSAQQTRILTANGKANEYYTSQRGFTFDETELPHHHLLRCRQRRQRQYYGSKEKKKKKEDVDDDDNADDSGCCNETHVMFRKWAAAAMQQQLHQQQHSSLPFSIVGAWKRTMFYNSEMDLSSEQRTSTDATETVYNIQTNTLFVDLRLPMAMRQILHEQLQQSNSNNRIITLNDLNAHQLRLYARQHVFAGFTRIQSISSEDQQNTTTTTTTTTTSAVTTTATAVVDAKLLCTRHHCIDWNFVGTPRARPNKWWVEPIVLENGTNSAWNEWAYATTYQGQHYYCERWERLQHLPNVVFVTDNSAATARSSSSANIAHVDDMDHHESSTTQRLVDNLVLALRKLPRTSTTRGDDEQDEKQGEHDDGVIVCVGSHFNYCFYTQPTTTMKDGSNHDNTKFSSLVDLVDDAVARGDLDYARAWLGRIQAGHGYITTTTTTTTAGSGGGWKVNAAIPQWHEEEEQQQQADGGGGLGSKKQSPLWQSRDEIKVVAVGAAAAAATSTSAMMMMNNHDDDSSTATIRSWTNDYCVSWKGELWEVLECSLTTQTQLETILWLGLNTSSRL